MLKKARNDAIFDAILSKAFEEAALEDIKELEKADIPEVELTAKHKREERRLYNQIEKSKNRPAWHYTAYKIAACFLICIAVGTATIFAIPNIRADFMKLIAKPFDKYTSFGAVTNSIFEDAEYTFEYIPEGFELVKYEKDFTKIFMYRNKNNEYFEIIYRQGKEIGSLQDNENVIATQVNIGNQIGYLVTNKNDENRKLIWSNGEYVFTIKGIISENILINIAENMHKK